MVELDGTTEACRPLWLVICPGGGFVPVIGDGAGQLRLAVIRGKVRSCAIAPQVARGGDGPSLVCA